MSILGRVDGRLPSAVQYPALDLGDFKLLWFVPLGSAHLSFAEDVRGCTLGSGHWGKEGGPGKCPSWAGLGL